MEELFPEELPPDFPEFPPLNPPPELEFDPEPEPFPELPPEFELEPEPFPPEPEPFPEGFVVVTVVTVVVCVSEEFPECPLKLSELELVVFFGMVVSLPVFVVVLPVSVNFPVSVVFPVVFPDSLEVKVSAVVECPEPPFFVVVVLFDSTFSAVVVVLGVVVVTAQPHSSFAEEESYHGL